jgi:hypothetical protein
MENDGKVENFSVFFREKLIDFSWRLKRKIAKKKSFSKLT